jgi:putative hydrolase of the HAD superfamily
MTAVWVNRNGRNWPSDLEPPDVQVINLNALADWLNGADRAL